MPICKNCRFNKKGYCCAYSSKTAISSNPTICISFKKFTKGGTNDIKRKSIKQEKRLAKDIGATRTPNSGAIATSPTDMVLGNYVIESKATKGKSISVREEWLSSLRQSPINFGKIPTLILEFPERKRYIIMAEDDFKNIIKER